MNRSRLSIATPHSPWALTGLDPTTRFIAMMDRPERLSRTSTRSVFHESTAPNDSPVRSHLYALHVVSTSIISVYFSLLMLGLFASISYVDWLIFLALSSMSPKDTFIAGM